MEAIPYQPEHQAACAGILRQRAPGREAEFLAYLADSPAFFVLQHEGVILGCGGIRQPPGQPAELVWGMIHPAWERRGLGRYLLLFRTRQTQAPTLDVVTPAAYAPFYERAGFRPLPAGAAADGAPDGTVHLRKKMAVCP